MKFINLISLIFSVASLHLISFIFYYILVNPFEKCRFVTYETKKRHAFTLYLKNFSTHIISLHNQQTDFEDFTITSEIGEISAKSSNPIVRIFGTRKFENAYHKQKNKSCFAASISLDRTASFLPILLVR